jgi:putative N6-adenine-specific DNA methylase
MQEFEMIAKTFQGLEEVLAEELTALGADNIAIGRRMVSFTGNKEMMYRANFCLRTALRILKPIARFSAKNADEVYEHVKALKWNTWLTTKTTFAVDSVVYSDVFRHSKFVAYRVKDAIADRFMEREGKRPSVRLQNPDLTLHIHIADTQCTLCLDSSGESLHRRGYRTEATEAPLNEVLAAGMILMTGWHGECDLIDPMCGSGTILVEAGLIACGIPPGVFRSAFAFEKWGDFDADLMGRIYNDDSSERPFTHRLYGYDILRQAIRISTDNVKRAGLSKYVSLNTQPLADFAQPAEPAILITNPPYGERLQSGRGTSILDLYALLGTKLKHEFSANDEETVGRQAWVISSNSEAFMQVGLRPSRKIELYNGALACEFRKYELFSGKRREYVTNKQESGRMGRPYNNHF